MIFPAVCLETEITASILKLCGTAKHYSVGETVAPKCGTQAKDISSKSPPRRAGRVLTFPDMVRLWSVADRLSQMKVSTEYVPNPSLKRPTP